MILAIDIGGTQFGLALASEDGRLVRRARGRTDRSGGASWMIERILEAGRKLLERSPGKVSACGIAFGGPVDFESQQIVNSTHVAGWDGVPLPDIVRRELKLRALMDNDANVGALGEFAFGAGVGCRNLVYYNIGTGIGGGIIIDGEIYRGSDGNAGELGHCPVLPDGPRCDCGNRGCLESLCSGKSIGNRAAEAVRRHPRRGRAIVECGDGEASAKFVFDAAREGDRLALEIVEETCRYLGMSVATAMNAFAPDTIVIGGSVSKAGRVLFDPLREEALRFVMPVHRPHLKIKRAKLGGNSQLLGAVAFAKSVLPQRRRDAERIRDGRH